MILRTSDTGSPTPNQLWNLYSMANQYLSYGAGPRAGQNLILACKCHALMHGKFSVDREDIVAVSKWVLRHRIVRNFKAEAEGVSSDQIIAAICN